MYTYKYPRPGLTADIVLMDPVRRSVLLIRRKNDPYANCWALPGGFFDIEDPDIEHTAARELEEETGLTDLNLELLCVASRKDRDPRGRTVSVVFVGLTEQDKVKAVGADDADEARWWGLDELPQLAFDHDEILAKAMARL